MVNPRTYVYLEVSDSLAGRSRPLPDTVRIDLYKNKRSDRDDR